MASVYGYCRVSTDRQGEGDSLEVQRRQVEGYAMMRGLDLAEVVVEDGVSGSIPVAERPAAGSLIASLGKGDIIVAAKLDRLFRSASDALHTVEGLKKRGVAVHLIDLGGEVTDGMSKLFLTIAAAFAEAERDRIRERAKASKADKRRRGLYLGGVVPFGWRRQGAELVAHAGEQAAIGEMVAMRASGATLRAISAALRVKGHGLSHEGVARVLRDQARRKRLMR